MTIFEDTFEVQFFLDSEFFFWNFATFHSFLVIKQTITFIIFELNLSKLAKIMGCKLVRLSQPILLDLCLHPSINAFLQDGCRYLLSIFKCSIAQKHSKIIFLLFSSGFFSSLSWTRPFDFSPVTKQFWTIKEVKIIFTWHLLLNKILHIFIRHAFQAAPVLAAQSLNK